MKNIIKKEKRIIEEIMENWTLNEIFTQFHEEPMCVFLDSSLQGELGNHSIVGIEPIHIVKVVNEQLFVSNGHEFEKIDMDLEFYLREYMSKNKEENLTNLPFLGGAIGYYSYDYGKKQMNIVTEKSINEEIQGNKIPDAMFCFYQYYLIEDHKKNKIYITSNCERKLAAFKNEIKYRMKKVELEKKINLKKEENEACCKDNKNKTFNLTKKEWNCKEKEYKQAIMKMKYFIREGDIYVANMTRQLKIESEMDPFVFFQNLRKENPAPFSVYLNAQEFQIISASPERFFQVKNRKISTRPIKGTVKRGENEKEDEAFKDQLLQSEKDRSELSMIIDLERNDFHKICMPDTVEVKNLFQIEKYATVFHLSATIEGVLKMDKDCFDVMKAVFPGGSITGAPKRRAMEIIDQLEVEQRGIYTGSIGYYSFDGNADFNIVIRTALCQDGTYKIGSGGGITWESEIDSEVEETLQKTKALEAIFESPNFMDSAPIVESQVESEVKSEEDSLALIETIAVKNKHALFEEEHYKRLKASAKEFALCMVTKKIFSDEIKKVIVSEKMKEGAVRVCFDSTGLSVTNRSVPNYPEMAERGLKISISEVIRNSSTKTLYYKTNQRKQMDEERIRLQQAGIDEVLFLNQYGEMTEGSISNLFCVKHGKLYTPEVSCGLLNGVIRSLIKCDFPLIETKIKRKDLQTFDEVFVTNSLMGIMPVSKIDDHEYNKGPMTATLIKWYENKCRSNIKAT